MHFKHILDVAAQDQDGDRANIHYYFGADYVLAGLICILPQDIIRLGGPLHHHCIFVDVEAGVGQAQGAVAKEVPY